MKYVAFEGHICYWYRHGNGIVIKKLQCVVALMYLCSNEGSTCIVQY